MLQRLELYFSVRHTLRGMRQFADLFEHDYDLVIIFLTVAETALQSMFHLAAVNAQDIDLDETYREIGAAGLSIMTIVESTGIPRETVRRKVRRLVDTDFLAIRAKDRHVYLPKTAITHPRLLELFNFHVADVNTLVRTIRFYSSDHRQP